MTLNKILFASTTLSLLLMTSIAQAGQGSLNGRHKFLIDDNNDGIYNRRLELKCNSHRTGFGEEFSCEYSAFDLGRNDALFQGRLYKNQRGSLFNMTALDDSSNFVGVYSGHQVGNRIKGKYYTIDGKVLSFMLI